MSYEEGPGWRGSEVPVGRLVYAIQVVACIQQPHITSFADRKLCSLPLYKERGYTKLSKIVIGVVTYSGATYTDVATRLIAFGPSCELFSWATPILVTAAFRTGSRLLRKSPKPGGTWCGGSVAKAARLSEASLNGLAASTKRLAQEKHPPPW